MTILFDEIVFGPVKSRRFGVSLGINLLPLSYKYCTFNCIYCECGWTINKNAASSRIFLLVQVEPGLYGRCFVFGLVLVAKFIEMDIIDVILSPFLMM